MNWNEIGTQVILSIIGVIISALGVFITYLVNRYIKNDEAKKIINSLHTLVQHSVLEIQQTYVDALKKSGSFDAEAQKEALNKCLELIKVNMPKDIETWLQANYSDIESYLKSLIEANIGLFKIKA